MIEIGPNLLVLLKTIGTGLIILGIFYILFK